MAARAGGARRKEVEDPNNTWNMQFMAAALRGDTAEAASLIAKGANPNHTVPEPSMKNLGVTPFMAVALRAAVAQPVGVNGNPNTVPQGTAPFAEIVNTLQWLCQNGADPNVQLDGTNKGTIFHHCVRADFNELADKLLLNRFVISKEPPPVVEPPPEEKGAKGKGGKKAAEKKEAEKVVQMSDAPAAPEQLPELADQSAKEDAAPKAPAADEPQRDLFDLEAVDDQGLTPLQLAVSLAKVDSGRVFLRHGIKHQMGAKIDGVRTLAQRACVLGQPAVLETLLNLGDDICQLSEDGQTLLHLAVAQPACLDVLVDRGANPNMANALGQTPLSFVVATMPDRGELIDGLLTRGADPNVGDRLLGTTPLMHAVMGYATDAIRRLVLDGKADVNVRDRMGCTALHYAAVARNRAVLEQLIGLEGADVNAKDANGHTPLHRACFARGKHEFVATLLTKDAVDVNIADNDGNTPLHVAVIRKNIAAVRALFPRVDAAGISGPLPPGVPGVTPQAAPAGKGDAKKPAAKKGAPAAPELTVAKLAVDAVNAEQLTALQLASAADNVAMVKVLVSIGADPKRASRYGNLVHEAVVHQRPQLVQLLGGDKAAGINDRNNDDKTPLHLAVETGNVDVVQAVLDCGGQPNDQDKQHLFAPLHIAVGLALTGIRNALLAAGAVVTTADTNARTPLHLACAVDDAEAVQSLLEHGASATASDIEGVTPLHLACANDAASCIDLLLGAGAEFWARDNRGRTPLHTAVACAAAACTKKLCDYVVAYNAEGPSALPQRVEYAAPALPQLAASMSVHPAAAAGRKASQASAGGGSAPAAAASSSGLAGSTSDPKGADRSRTSADAEAEGDEPPPPRPESRQSRCASRGSKRAPSASSLDPAATIERDGATVAVDGAAARAKYFREAAAEQAKRDWTNAMQLQDADGNFLLALAAASGSSEVAKTLVRTNAALTARARGEAGLPPRPPSVATRSSDL